LSSAAFTSLFQACGITTSVGLKSELNLLSITGQGQILICFRCALKPRVVITYTYTFQPITASVKQQAFYISAFLTPLIVVAELCALGAIFLQSTTHHTKT
jgi:hypothetical protein